MSQRMIFIGLVEYVLGYEKENGAESEDAEREREEYEQKKIKIGMIEKEIGIRDRI